MIAGSRPAAGHGAPATRRLALLAALLAPILALAQSGGPVMPAVPPPSDRLFVSDLGAVRVTAAVPSADETQSVFGADLYGEDIQPVWLRIENPGSEPVWLLPYGVDRAYFLPYEVAGRVGSVDRAATANPARSEFSARQIPMQIDGGTSAAGYVYSRVDVGTKSFNVDILGDEQLYTANFAIPVPGLRVDHYETDWTELYPEDEIVDVDLDGLVAGLRSLPCCVRDGKDRADGDPLNIAVVGERRDLYHAFMRAGWDETETVYGLSLLRMGISTLIGREYRYSPVSALYVFGRPQDVALQKARSTIDERNHLRLWLTPMRYEGKPVWIGQISRDIGVRFTRKTITTHKIDPDVDETREYLIEDLAYAQGLEAFGHVRGVGAAPFDEPRGNLTGDPYFTDGRRAVLFLSAEPVDILEVEALDMESSR